MRRQKLITATIGDGAMLMKLTWNRWKRRGYAKLVIRNAEGVEWPRARSWPGAVWKFRLRTSDG